MSDADRIRWNEDWKYAEEQFAIDEPREEGETVSDYRARVYNLVNDYATQLYRGTITRASPKPYLGVLTRSKTKALQEQAAAEAAKVDQKPILAPARELATQSPASNINQATSSSSTSAPAAVVEQSSAAVVQKTVSKPTTMPPKKELHNQSGLVGQVSLGLAPDRNFISAPGKMHLRFERVVRNLVLRNWGAEFCGKPLQFTDVGNGTAAYLNPYKHYQAINANLIHLDDNSIALTARDEAYLDSLPITKMHVKGGKITFNGLRYLENVVSGTTALRMDQTNNIQNIDRKVMWKMFDRERDYCWSPCNNLTDVITLNGAEDDLLKTNVLRDKSKSLYNTAPEWQTLAFPCTALNGESPNLVESSRLHEMLNDHSLNDGPLEFPIMGHPFPIVCGNQIGDLHFTTGKYPKATVKTSELIKTSFVNYSGCSVANYVKQMRIAKINSQGILSKNLPSKAGSATKDDKAYKSSFDYRPYCAASLPGFDLLKNKCDEVTSSHCAIIHVPQFPKSDGKVDLTVVLCDVTMECYVEVDLHRVRNCAFEEMGCLGEMWEDTIDAELNPFVPLDGLNPVKLRNNREQWYSPYWQFATNANLKKTVVTGAAVKDKDEIPTTFHSARWIRAGLAMDSGWSTAGKEIVLGEQRNRNVTTPYIPGSDTPAPTGLPTAPVAPGATKRMRPE